MFLRATQPCAVAPSLPVYHTVEQGGRRVVIDVPHRRPTMHRGTKESFPHPERRSRTSRSASLVA